ncbi:beta-galactosidase, partial [Paenibacillus sp. MCAF20]
MKKLPYLKEENGVTSLYVDGEPYIALGGEIHNSSSSNLEYMKEKVWPFLRNLHLNTLCVPVFWELIEPEQD